MNNYNITNRFDFNNIFEYTNSYNNLNDSEENIFDKVNEIIDNIDISDLEIPEVFFLKDVTI